MIFLKKFIDICNHEVNYEHLHKDVIQQDMLFNKTLNFPKRLGRLLFSVVHFFNGNVKSAGEANVRNFGFVLVLSSF